MAALREEVAKREGVISQNYETIQLLRRRATDLEKHKFVLSYRTQELAQNLEPKEEAIADLTNQLQMVCICHSLAENCCVERNCHVESQ